MKFKHFFAFAIALAVLLSMVCVAAGENVTEELSVQDGGLDKLSAEGDVDLSVELDVKPSYVDGRYNSIGSEVPWTVTVIAKGGTAKNTQVRVVLSANLGYVKHNATAGEYNPKTRIWKVGDLTDSSASLTILTKINRVGTFSNKAYATTDSKDSNMLNNFAFLSIQTDSSKVTSNITQTTDDRLSPNHNPHYASMISDRLKESDDESYHSKDDSKFKGDEESSDSNSKERYPLTKSQSVVQRIFGSLLDLNSTSDSRDNQLNIHVNGIISYDFVKIPILIFVLFLIVLAGIVVEDKIRNKSK